MFRVRIVETRPDGMGRSLTSFNADRAHLLSIIRMARADGFTRARGSRKWRVVRANGNHVRFYFLPLGANGKPVKNASND